MKPSNATVPMICKRRFPLFLTALRLFFKTRVCHTFLILLLGLTGQILILQTTGAQSQSSQNRGVSLVRDTEIENTLRVYAAPIFNAAGLDASAVRIHLVRDDALNAFVANGQRIFFHTGLLSRAETPDEVIGVLAHEAGHITGGHLARFNDGIRDATNSNLAALLIGIPLALLTQNGEVAAAAASLGNQVSTRQILAFTRANEQSADQAAVDFLDAAGMSSRGLLAFMKVMMEQNAAFTTASSPYAQTHPLSVDRIAFFENHLATSRYATAQLEPFYQRLHDRMRAKLFGYLAPTNRVLSTHADPEGLKNDDDINALYARAIALMRESRTDDALAAAARLIENAPEDAFFYELRADILRDGARLSDAIADYEKALEFLPWAALIRLNLAQTLVELNEAALDDQAENHLREALRYEPWLVSAWRLLATVYGRRGDFGQTALAQAEEAIYRGEKQKALGHAKRALDLLPEGSPNWLRAQDIEIQAQRKN